MFEILKTQNIGRIYQVSGRLFLNKYRNASIIQTFGTPIHRSIKCTSKEELMEILASSKDTEFLIYTISSFTVDCQLYNSMRMSNCRGVTLILYTFDSHRVWYADTYI
ncbi:hypothetical protein PAEPH01_0508 [Pancytospora epiphaga]|nr:hypothetical protein PAEPH01_0508 [Pancytospora epiphaga]